MQLVQQEGQIQIKGVVKDAGGDPLIGVNVKVKDSTVGTITDINGNFTLQTRKGDILEISYVGYATKTVKVQNAQVLNIVLTEDIRSTEMKSLLLHWVSRRKLNLCHTMYSK